MTTELPRMTFAQQLLARPDNHTWYATMQAYHHAYPDFLTASLLFHGVVQHDIQEYLFEWRNQHCEVVG